MIRCVSVSQEVGVGRVFGEKLLLQMPSFRLFVRTVPGTIVAWLSVFRVLGVGCIGQPGLCLSPSMVQQPRSTENSQTNTHRPTVVRDPCLSPVHLLLRVGALDSLGSSRHGHTFAIEVTLAPQGLAEHTMQFPHPRILKGFLSD